MDGWMPIADSIWACRSSRNTLSIPQQTPVPNISHLKTFDSLPAIDSKLILLKSIKLHQGSICFFFIYIIFIVNMLLLSLLSEDNYCSSLWLHFFSSAVSDHSASELYLGLPSPLHCHTGATKVTGQHKDGFVSPGPLWAMRSCFDITQKS